jgi:hypothetical protein
VEKNGALLGNNNKFKEIELHYTAIGVCFKKLRRFEPVPDILEQLHLKNSILKALPISLISPG